MKKIMLFPILLLSLLSLLSCEKSRKSLGEKDVLGVWGLGVGLPEETFGVGVRRPKEPPPMLFRLFSNGDVWGYRYGNGSWIPKLNDYVDWETGVELGLAVGPDCAGQYVMADEDARNVLDCSGVCFTSDSVAAVIGELENTGASFAFATDMVNDCSSAPPSPSLTVKTIV